MSFFRNAAGVFATSIASLPIGLASSVVLARWLSVEDRGLYSVAVSFSGMAALMLQLGWPSASVFRLKRIGSQPAQVASAALVAAAVAAGLLVAGSVVFEDAIMRSFLEGAPRPVFYLAVAVVPFQILATLFQSIARGIDRFGLQNGFQLALITSILAATAGALILGDGAIESALAALLASQIVVTIVFVAVVLRHTGVTLRIAPGELRESLRFGSKSYMQSLAGQLHERIDILLLAYLLADPKAIAVYAVAAGVTQRLKLLPESIGVALLPRLASLSDADAARFASYVCRHSLAWSLLIALSLALCAPLLITLLYGVEYRDSVTPFLVLLPGMLFLTVYRVLARYFTAIDRQGADVATQSISLALNVALNLLWIPRYGINGAAAASLVSYAMEMVLIVAVFRCLTGVKLRDSFFPQRGDAQIYRERLTSLAARLRPAR